MSLPNMETMMLPLLKILGDQQEHSRSEVIDILAHQFDVSEVERELKIANGQGKFDNLTYWVRAHFIQEEVIENLENSHFRITAKGLRILKSNPPSIDLKFLREFPDE